MHDQAAIVKAGTEEVAVELAGMNLKIGDVLWAPDSRRFAYNYQQGGRYWACSVYELAGSTWKELPEFEEKATAVKSSILRSEQLQRKRLGVSKDAYRRRISDTWKVRHWVDEDTLEVFAFSEGSVVVNKKAEDFDSLVTGVLSTARCDNKGGWKIIASHECSKAELKKIRDEEDPV